MDAGNDSPRRRGSETDTMAVDPICGMTLDAEKAKHKAIHQGTTYFFCCAGCKSTFEADPGRFLKKDDESAHCCSVPASRTAAATDPVCGMSVDPHAAKYRATYEGRPFYFCSAGCKVKFERDPKR